MTTVEELKQLVPELDNSYVSVKIIRKFKNICLKYKETKIIKKAKVLEILDQKKILKKDRMFLKKVFNELIERAPIDDDNSNSENEEEIESDNETESDEEEDNKTESNEDTDDENETDEEEH